MRSLMTGYLLAILPLIFMVVLSLIGNSPAKANFSLLGLTALPGFYFFTAYQLHINRKIRNISLTMNFYSLGILVQFVLNFLILIIPPSLIPPNGINFISFLIINFIVVTGFGILLVIPALANDQTDLFLSETYTLRISANRSAAFINFILILAPVSLLFLLGFSGGDNQSFGNTLVYMTIVIVCVSISLIIYPKYSAFFNRVILGIRHPPEELIRNYAHRITTSLDISALAQLLTTEILPSLLIRESALFYFAGQSRVKKLFSTGVKLDDQKVIQALCMNLPSSIQNLKINDDDILPWAHFILPLQIESDVLGIWVFGRKDPDNIYDQELIKDLKSLGNQTTLALLNIRQASLLQALYESNIDRQEAQKAGIARDLHDVLLPSIGYLAELQSNNCDTLEFEEAVQRVNNMVREIMSGLRPSSLDMGLTIAIEELADEPEAQIGGKINIFAELNTPATPIYYDKLVELHLYRMVQQACRNALVHAHAGAVHIKGSLTEDTIDLVVEDDGIGLPFEGMPDLGLLIINRHFGLANIVERAKIIHADVQIESKPNKGARLHFRWTAGEPSA
jgi:signal transduction histidine kinase